MPESKDATKPRRTRKRKPPAPRGLEANELKRGSEPRAVADLVTAIETDGGSVIGTYRDPLGGSWQVLAGIPLTKVEPTPYQRDLSEPHVKRLSSAIDKLGRFLDPVIVVRTEAGAYWTPNGHHRVAAMRALGARSVVALVVPEPEVAHRILVLNTEKAHNLRERALEVIRLAEGLVEIDDRPEKEFGTEFEEASLLTLGACYQKNGRFPGAAFNPVLRKTEQFLPAKLSKALQVRREHAARLLELSGAVDDAITRLKERGFDSPYLRAFVVARINPLRFTRRTVADFDETIDKMQASATTLDVGKVKPDQIAKAGGPVDE